MLYGINASIFDNKKNAFFWGLLKKELGNLKDREKQASLRLLND